MGKCQQTMNSKRKTKNRQRKENARALRLRKGLVQKNKDELARVSGVARTGKQARKQLKVARRIEREKAEKALKRPPRRAPTLTWTRDHLPLRSGTRRGEPRVRVCAHDVHCISKEWCSLVAVRIVDRLPRLPPLTSGPKSAGHSDSSRLAQA